MKLSQRRILSLAMALALPVQMGLALLCAMPANASPAVQTMPQAAAPALAADMHCAEMDAPALPPAADDAAPQSLPCPHCDQISGMPTAPDEGAVVAAAPLLAAASVVAVAAPQPAMILPAPLARPLSPPPLYLTTARIRC